MQRRIIVALTCEVTSCHAVQILRSRHGLSKAAVPFGALITPLPRLQEPTLPPVLQRNPTACAACGAYLNAYCKVCMEAVCCSLDHTLQCPVTHWSDNLFWHVQVQADNVTWHCCFCGTSNSPAAVTDLRVHSPTPTLLPCA